MGLIYRTQITPQLKTHRRVRFLRVTEQRQVCKRPWAWAPSTASPAKACSVGTFRRSRGPSPALTSVQDAPGPGQEAEHPSPAFTWGLEEGPKLWVCGSPGKGPPLRGSSSEQVWYGGCWGDGLENLEPRPNWRSERGPSSGSSPGDIDYRGRGQLWPSLGRVCLSAPREPPSPDRNQEADTSLPSPAGRQ